MCEILPKMHKFACNYFQNSSASAWGLRSPDHLTGFRPWTPLGDSRSPDPLWFCPNPKPPSAAFDIQDLITRASFGDDRLRVLGVARGRISYFPIDLRRRSYNTLALPCECLMCGCVCGWWVCVTLRAKLCCAVYCNRFRLFVSVFRLTTASSQCLRLL